MILADLNVPKRGIENLQTAVKYYVNSDTGILKTGRYNICDDKLIAIVNSYQTKSPQEAIWESHRKYVDVQYIISGKEKMGFSPISSMKMKRPYKDEDDCIFYEGNGKHFTMQEGKLVICTPGDVHKPGLNPVDPAIVKKLIFKVHVHFLDFSPELIIDFARTYQN
ncbi:MAG: YhcH/YjgK/YiaL family protein [Cytophagaceae bacterium]|nr:YhcH/YjgK/YiaL family protein [Cytophagaceae bacterium]